MDSVIKDILVALIASATTLLGIYLRNLLEKKKVKQTRVTVAVGRDLLVYELLNDLRDKFCFSRVIVMLFHNGSKYYNGEDIQKESAAYETVTPGVPVMARGLLDVPISADNYLLSKLHESGVFRMDSIEDISDEAYRDLIQSYKITGMYSFKLVDKIGWFGFLMCSYNNFLGEKMHPILTDACIANCQLQAKRLSSMLTK